MTLRTVEQSETDTCVGLGFCLVDPGNCQLHPSSRSKHNANSTAGRLSANKDHPPVKVSAGLLMQASTVYLCSLVSDA